MKPVTSPCWARWWAASTAAENKDYLMANAFPSLPDRANKRVRTEVALKLPAQINDAYPRFHVVHSEQPSRTARNLSPFLVSKSLTDKLGPGFKVTKMASGDLLLEVCSKIQHDKLNTIQTFGDVPVTITKHKSMNTVRGVVSDDDLIELSETELLEGWGEHNVINVQRIKIRRDDKEIPTKHLILTFGSSTLPEHIETGYIRMRVRPYIPNPRRCFKCQRYGHGSQGCRGRLTCAKCSSHDHPADECSNSPHCINCDGGHPSYSRVCPAWKREKDIISLKVRENISFKEARRRFSIVSHRTYADAAFKGAVQQQLPVAVRTPDSGAKTKPPAPMAGLASSTPPPKKDQQASGSTVQKASPAEERPKPNAQTRSARSSSVSDETMDTTQGPSAPSPKGRQHSVERLPRGKLKR